MNDKSISINKKQCIVLASASPRRKEILDMVGIYSEVIPSTYVEPKHSDHLTDPVSFASEIAVEKGKEVFHRLNEKRIVLSADTIGVIDGEVLEKPIDRKDAKRMLKKMSGNTHIVITAISIFSPKRPNDAFTKNIKTFVTFRDIDDEEIEDYLDRGEYLDKSASYSIQGRAAIFIEKLSGDYYNVMGLPVVTVWNMLKCI